MQNNNDNNNNNPFDDKNRQQRSNRRWPTDTVGTTASGLPDANFIRQGGLGSTPQFRHVAVAPAAQAQAFSFAPPALQMPNVMQFPTARSATGFASASSLPSPSIQPPGGGFVQRQQWGPTMPNLSVNAPKAGVPRSYSEPVQLQTPVAPPVDTSYGWDPEKVVFEPMDPYFPKEMMKLEINPEDVDRALKNMQGCFKRLSIQVEFENNPAGARLRTLEHIELYLIFFEDEDKKLSIDIQRRQGDYLIANAYIHQILDAASGAVIEEPTVSNPSAQGIQEFEGFLENVSAMSSSTTPEGAKGSPWASPPTAEESMRSTLGNIHASITSAHMDQRKVGLDNLAVFTDLEKALSTTAVASSLVVVAGKPPAPEFQKQCKDVQQALARVIMKQEFAGDDTNMYADMDSDIVGFMASDNTKKEGRSRYYDNYMNEMFHATLNILANSLEVLQVFKDHGLQPDLKTAVAELNSACMSAAGSYDTGIVQALMQIIAQARQRLPDAYLACKALRLVLASNSDLHAVFRGNPSYTASVKSAVQAGSVHRKLLSEATKLQAFL